MIEKIGIQNMRVFKDTAEFELAPITILTGANNSGKSTLQKLLFLLKNSIRSQNGNILLDSLNFDEESISTIGDFQSNLSFNSQSEKLCFSFVINDKGLGKLNIRLVFLNDGTADKLPLKTIIVESKDLKYSLDNLILSEYLAHNGLSGKLSKEEFTKMSKSSVWCLQDNNGLDKLCEDIHHVLLIDKQKFLLEKSLHREFLNEPLSQDELDIHSAIVAKGYILNYHPNAENVVDAIGCIWDPVNKRTVDDAKPNWISSTYSDQSKHTVISTFLSNLILGPMDILDKKIEDENLRSLKNHLAEHSILTKDDFKKEYKRFEHSVIRSAIAADVEHVRKEYNLSFESYFYSPNY